MKKIINRLLIAALALSAIGCQKQTDEPAIVLPTDWTWYMSNYPGTELERFVDTYVSIRDLSQNALSRKWTIDEGCHYLIPSKDLTQNDIDFSEYVDDTKKDGISTDIDVHIWFETGGPHSITLENTFDEEVSFNSEDQEGIEVYKDETTGKWVARKTFQFTIFGEADPAYVVYKIEEDSTETELIRVAQGEAVDSVQTNWQTVTFEVGTQLKFVDLTTEGYPQERAWSIPNVTAGAATSADSVAIVTFNSIGKFQGAKLTESHTITQVTKNYSKFIPLVFNVTPSTKPIAVNKAIAPTLNTDNKTLVLTLGGSAKTIAENAAQHFTVILNNSTAGVVDKVIPVKEVAVDATNKQLLNVVLTEQLYGDDQVTVAYDGDLEAVLSESGTPLTAFTALAVNVENEVTAKSIITNTTAASFESGAGTPANGWWSHKENQGGKYLTLTYDKAAEGRFSLLLQADANVEKNIQFMTNEKFTLADKAVKYRYKMFIDPSTVLSDNTFTVTSWIVGGSNIDNVVDLTTTPMERWVTYTSEITKVTSNAGVFNNRLEQKYLTTDPDNNLMIYFDCFDILLIETRPF